MSESMTITLNVWRQKDKTSEGRFVRYTLSGVSPDMSFLEMLDLLNLDLIRRGEEPVAFDHDCREGICGTCSLYINGRAHGPLKGVTACQLHMRTFHDGDAITVEPWRARAFPVIRDLVVDRSAFDRIMAAGGFVSVRTGGAPDANTIPIPKPVAEEAMDAAACIGCGACVAACKNGGWRRWSPRWTRRGSAPARTRTHAKPNARNRYPSRTSPGLTRNT
jgi:succinate dehydrogenase / fumarate reductase iron-sulfur subunit